MTTTRNTKAPLADGQAISYQAGNAMITLQCVRPGAAYTVSTVIGAHRNDDWSRSYTSEIEARSAARHVALAFREWGRDVMIEVRRARLNAALPTVLRGRTVTISGVRMNLAEVEAALDAIATLADRAAYLAAASGLSV
jgi:hypothetical protein